jgi:hypothetical protein
MEEREKVEVPIGEEDLSFYTPRAFMIVVDALGR